MLMQGCIFMIVGMTIVFLFLGIMVLVINLMAYLVKFFPEKEDDKIDSVSKVTTGMDEIAVAIAAARKAITN